MHSDSASEMWRLPHFSLKRFCLLSPIAVAVATIGDTFHECGVNLRYLALVSMRLRFQYRMLFRDLSVGCV